MQCLSDKGHSCMHHFLKVCTIFKPKMLNQLKFPLKIQGKFDIFFKVSKVSPFIGPLLCVMPLRDTSK